MFFSAAFLNDHPVKCRQQCACLSTDVSLPLFKDVDWSVTAWFINPRWVWVFIALQEDKGKSRSFSKLQAVSLTNQAFVSVKWRLFHTIITQNNKIIITVAIKGLLRWNSRTDAPVETPACEQGPHYAKRQTGPLDNGLSFDPVQFNTDWIKQNIALSFALKLHSSKYCGGWKEETRGKPRRQINK